MVFLGNMKRLLTTGVSRWNTRQIALWDQVSQPQEAGRRATSKGCSPGALLGLGEVSCHPAWILILGPRLQEDLSMPLIEEEIDGLSGLLFPFYDADTHMLYLAGKVVEGGGGAGAACGRTSAPVGPSVSPYLPRRA